MLAVLLVVMSVSADSSGWSWQSGNCGIPPQVGGILYDQTITIQPDSQVCVIPPSYQMTFGPRYYVGIEINGEFFQGSSYADPRCKDISGETATIHSTTYCTSESLRWPGTITYTAPATTCFCDSCSDCNTKLGSSCTTVYLTADINDHYGKCIEFPASSKVFDCQGHSIDGDDVNTSPDYGIYMSVKSGNTVRNCVITDFDVGISMEAPYPDTYNNNQLVDNIVSSNRLGIGVWGNSDYPSSSNTVARNVVENNDDGIMLMYTNSNTVDDNEVNSNGRGLVFGGYTSNNTITNNTAKLNENGIAFYANTLNNTSVNSNTSCSSLSTDIFDYGTNNQGDHNTCDSTLNWDDASAVSGCQYACPATDTDSDGVLDSSDNCITEYNPDQFDTDGDFAGDVCDVCPSDPGDTCDASGSAGETIGAGGGTLSPSNGEVQITIPVGSLSVETSLSITKEDNGTIGLNTSLGTGESVYAYNFLPSGQSFSPTATVVFSWLDEDNDGLEDTKGMDELSFQIFRYEDPFYVPITDPCGTDLNCDATGNTITVDLDGFSYYALIQVKYYIYLPLVLRSSTP
jgi:parallel beta-helix repeat protein